MLWLLINIIPARTKGIPSIRAIKKPVATECVLFKLNIKINILNARPIMVRIIPPTFSHLHATRRTISKANDGIRCIPKAAKFCQKVRSVEKESRAKKLMKRMARMQRILGVQ